MITLLNVQRDVRRTTIAKITGYLTILLYVTTGAQFLLTSTINFPLLLIACSFFMVTLWKIAQITESIYEPMSKKI